MLGGGIAGGFHGDVLNANPTDEEGKRRLVDEIKSRAKGSITSKNYPEAVQLYSKAIELFPQDAILHANRSMCYLSMNNANSALSDAQEATKLDPTYAKGFYRLGMAQLKLNDRSAAKQSFLQGIALVPDDKDFRQQLDKLHAAGVESNSTAAPTAAGTPKETKTAVSTAARAQREPEPDAASDEKEESIGIVRGYKRTSDGRVTTFFNNELDETTKSLIGNIAPKKIDVPATVAVSAAPAANGVSVWNSAGKLGVKCRRISFVVILLPKEPLKRSFTLRGRLRDCARS
jgi:tetratricopeptide (TPR) repeat protein